MRKLIAVAAALGFLGATSLPVFAQDQAPKTNKSSAMKKSSKKKSTHHKTSKKKSHKSKKSNEKKSGLILYRIAA